MDVSRIAQIQLVATNAHAVTIHIYQMIIKHVWTSMNVQIVH